MQGGLTKRAMCYYKMQSYKGMRSLINANAKWIKSHLGVRFGIVGFEEPIDLTELKSIDSIPVSNFTGKYYYFGIVKFEPIVRNGRPTSIPVIHYGKPHASVDDVFNANVEFMVNHPNRKFVITCFDRELNLDGKGIAHGFVGMCASFNK